LWLADDSDVEVPGLERTPQAEPEREIHLGAAGGGDVAEIDDVLCRPAALSSNAVTSAFAPSSFPQTKTSCSPGTFDGSTITSQFIVLSDFTTRASGNARWICSARLSVLETSRLGGVPCGKSSAFETSTRVLPARSSSGTEPSASIEAAPAVQLKRSSPNAAASANVPWLAAPPAEATHSAACSLSVVRDPIITSWPRPTSLVAIDLPTIPVPKTPMRMCASL
jgi:hypothetical protein